MNKIFSVKVGISGIIIIFTFIAIFPFPAAFNRLENQFGQEIASVSGGFKISVPQQKIEVAISPKGATFNPNSKNDARDKFSIFPVELGAVPVPSTGIVSVYDQSSIYLDRGIISEQFTSISKGIRQNFIIHEKKSGNDVLTLLLSVKGAKVTNVDNEIILTTESGRKFVYGYLNVSDSSGKKLNADMKAINSNEIKINVYASNACYPIIIDPTITDADWAGMNVNNILGTNGPVYAQLWYKGNLYIAGRFSMAGNIRANNIVKWDGNKWDSLGSGTDSTVNALAVDSNGILYAGGMFNKAGGVSIKRIAKWNGSSWSALDTNAYSFAPNQNVNEIAVDIYNNIYMSGNFKTIYFGNDSLIVNYIAKFDGTQWSDLANGVKNNITASTSITALTCDKNGNVFVGGRFDTAGEIHVGNIARWNGTQWDSLGSGVTIGTDGNRCLLSLISDNNGNIYVGGSFFISESYNLALIAKWDGNKWANLDSTFLFRSHGDEKVYTLLLDNNGNLYAAGLFYAGNKSANNIVMLKDTTWVSLKQTIDDSIGLYNNIIFSLTISDSNILYAGGTFRNVSGVRAKNIAQWNGTDWHSLGDIVTPVYDTVWAVLSDHKGNLYIGGNFKKGILKWNGESWDSVGNGVNGNVYALCMDSNSNIYAAGKFDSAGTRKAKNIAMWNGEKWIGLDLGVSPGPIMALVCDTANNIYAGGYIDTARDITPHSIAKWDGYIWDSLGGGLNRNTSPMVYSLSINKYGTLFAGGIFDSAGHTLCKNMAKWDGTTWNSTGMTITTYCINAITNDKYGNIYFATCGTTPYTSKSSQSYIYSINDSGQTRIGIANKCVSSMTIDSNNYLYATGFFDSLYYGVSGSCKANGLALWKNNQWESMGSGLYTSGNAITIQNSVLFAAGGFYFAGNICSPYIAKVDIGNVTADIKKYSTPQTVHPYFRVRNNILYFDNIKSEDKLLLYSVSGKIIYKTTGVNRIKLDNISPQTIIVNVCRNGKSILSGMFIKSK
jgi:trimeric autotransporter adhesin